MNTRVRKRISGFVDPAYDLLSETGVARFYDAGQGPTLLSLRLMNWDLFHIKQYTFSVVAMPVPTIDLSVAADLFNYHLRGIGTLSVANSMGF